MTTKVVKTLTDVVNHLQHLTVYQYNNKIRLGAANDGGYIVADLSEYDCYISAGVANEESFSRDFISRYGMKKSRNYAFDGTIADYPYEYTREINFIKKNIATYDSESTTDLHWLIRDHCNIFLKMDIEGAEIPWLLKLKSKQLLHFKQIVMEFHGVNDNTYGYHYNDKVKCLGKLAETHYLVHAHANLCGNLFDYDGKKFPNLLELTYVRKNLFDVAPELNTSALPDPILDEPNAVGYRDVDLNFPPFVNRSSHKVDPIISILGSDRQHELKSLYRNTALDQILTYPHYSKEVVQALEYCKYGNLKPEETQLCFRSGILDNKTIPLALVRDPFLVTDIFVIEIASIKSYEYKTDENKTLYCHHIVTEPGYNSPIIDKVTIRDLSDDEIESDVLKMRELILPAKMLIVSHIYTYKNGKRYELAMLLKRICERNKIAFIDPAILQSRYTVDRLYRSESVLTHYTDFGSEKIGQLYRSVIDQM